VAWKGQERGKNRIYTLKSSFYGYGQLIVLSDVDVLVHLLQSHCALESSLIHLSMVNVDQVQQDQECLTDSSLTSPFLQR
jgi:hypothetical protein